jgi:hypothetical protein
MDTTTRRYDAFREVMDLSTEQASQLLLAGDPVERLWAAWTLGLRRGVAAAGELARALEGEPSPGTRHQIVIMLAGLRHVEALRALAHAEPSPDIRAAACQYLARLVEPSDLVTYDLLMNRMANDEARQVRASILHALRDDAPEVVRARAERCAQALALPPPATADEAPAAVDPGVPPGKALVERLELHAYREDREALISQHLNRVGVDTLIGEVAGAPVWAVEEALLVAAVAERVTSWDRVEPLVARGDIEVDYALMWLFDAAMHQVPCAWLLRFLLRSGDTTITPRHMGIEYRLQEQAARRVMALLAGSRPEDLDHQERAGVRALRRVLEAAGEEYTECWDDSVWDMLPTLARLDDAADGEAASSPASARE